MLSRNDRKLLKRLLKLCKGRQNLVQCGLEPAVGECGTVYIQSPEDFTLTGAYYFSFRILLKQGYIEEYIKEYHLYRLTAEAHRYFYFRRKAIWRKVRSSLRRPIACILGAILTILATLLTQYLLNKFGLTPQG